MGWIASFRQPLLTERERALRWCTLLATFVMLAGIAIAVQPWWPLHRQMTVGILVAAVAGAALFVVRQFLLRAMEQSRGRLRSAGYLICTNRLQPLEGTRIDPSQRKRDNAIRGTMATCPECGTQTDAGALQLRWREDYRIHLDAWTPDPDQSD